MSKADILRLPEYLGHIVEAIEQFSWALFVETNVITPKQSLYTSVV